jgi:DNA-binding NarL/FixJ family response regulator
MHSGKQPSASCAGETEIPARRRQVLALVAEGLSNKEIAAGLSISETTAKKHVRDLFRTYGVPNRAALVRAALVAGDLELNQDMSRGEPRPVARRPDKG